MNLLKGIYKEKSPIFQLGVLIFSILFGSLLSSTIGYGLFFLIYGFDANIMQYPLALRMIQLISALGTFLLPAFIMAQTCSNNVGSYLSIQRLPSAQSLVGASICLLLLTPTITLTGMLNMQLKLPRFLASLEEWMISQENAMQAFTELLIGDGSVFVLLSNLIVIALAAGLTEEFLFRGALQRVLERMTANLHFSIWITAILFSAFHLQFYGFIPRMLLGAFFGYLLYWSKNIWIPVFTHFLNNAIAVIGMSDTNWKESEFISGKISNEHLIPYIISAVFTLIIFYYCCKLLREKLKEESSEIFLS